MGLLREIAALRVYIRRFIKTFGQGAALGDRAGPNKAAISPYHDLVFLAAIGLAATRLACLLKTQRLLDHQHPPASQDLSQALAEGTKELGLQLDP